MKTNEEINRYFTEEVFGKCWHEAEEFINQTIHNNTTRCIKCKKLAPIISGTNFQPKNPDYFSKEGFWDIYDFVYSDKFYSNGFIRYAKGIPASKVFHYSQLAREVYEFLEGKK